MALFDFFPMFREQIVSAILNFCIVSAVSVMCLLCIFYTLRTRQFFLSGIGVALLFGLYLSIFGGGA